MQCLFQHTITMNYDINVSQNKVIKYINPPLTKNEGQSKINENCSWWVGINFIENDWSMPLSTFVNKLVLVK